MKASLEHQGKASSHDSCKSTAPVHTQMLMMYFMCIFHSGGQMSGEELPHWWLPDYVNPTLFQVQLQASLQKTILPAWWALSWVQIVLGTAPWPVWSGKSPTAENDPALDMLQLPSMGPASDELWFICRVVVQSLEKTCHWACEWLCSVQHIDKVVLCFSHWQHPNSAVQILAKMEASAYGTDRDQNSPAGALNLSEGDSARSVGHNPSGGGVNLQRVRLASSWSQTTWCYSCSILGWLPVTVPRAWLHRGTRLLGSKVRERGWLL